VAELEDQMSNAEFMAWQGMAALDHLEAERERMKPRGARRGA
jgi:hypothetical protein